MGNTEGKTQAVETIKELIDGIGTCVIATHTADGGIVTRPMGVQDKDFDGDLWFMTSRDSDLVEQITANDQVNVTFVGKGTWVSLRGRAELVEDPQRKEELASALTGAFLQADPKSPEAALIRVNTEAGEYWSSEGAKTVLEIITARAPAARPDAGKTATGQRYHNSCHECGPAGTDVRSGTAGPRDIWGRG